MLLEYWGDAECQALKAPSPSSARVKTASPPPTVTVATIAVVTGGRRGPSRETLSSVGSVINTFDNV